MLLERVCLLLVNLGLLEFETVRGIAHKMAVMLDYLIDTALQKAYDFLDSRIVFGSGNLARTASCASSDMEIQAGPVSAAEYGIRCQLMVAGPYLVVPVKEFKQIAGMHYGTVGPEIAVPFHDPAGQVNLRELVSRDAYPRIGLGILQENVVFRPVLLYEIILKKQGVRLGIHHGILRVRNLGNQNPGLGREPLGRGEILGHPLVEILGLAHIYHNPLGVIIPVDSGGMWKQ